MENIVTLISEENISYKIKTYIKNNKIIITGERDLEGINPKKMFYKKFLFEELKKKSVTFLIIEDITELCKTLVEYMTTEKCELEEKEKYLKLKINLEKKNVDDISLEIEEKKLDSNLENINF